MQLPQELLHALYNTPGFNKETFERIHSSGEQVTSIRYNPFKKLEIENSKSKIPWTDHGYYLETRPSFTFDPLFHAGCYYVQEASSMFLEQALKQTIDLSKSLKVLDLCAAPGGKSTHIQSLISKESLLVSNEVIRARANVLKDNIVKWGCENVMVTNNDPKDFSGLENYFDVIVVDAPCSGSGLFRRDPEAIKEWSENNVQLCSQRQQRILADVWPALKKDGILIYSTCSYSKEEDEDIIQWINDNFLTDTCPIDIEEAWNIIPSSGGYRFWPDKVKGEGFFLACFRKKDGETEPSKRVKNKVDELSKKELAVLHGWVNTSGKRFVKHLSTVYAWPEQLYADLSFLLEKLRIIYSGVLVGELIRDKLVPDHALALSNIIDDAIEKTELGLEEAIAYLQRKDLRIETGGKGWRTVAFRGHRLGWINVLPNRINNYYPKEMRIIKDN